MKDKIREMLEYMIPTHGAHPNIERSFSQFRKSIIDALADGAEIVYGRPKRYFGESTNWNTHKGLGDNSPAIRLKPQPIDCKVTKSEIVKALRSDTSISDSWDLSNRIERYGVKDGE